MTTQLNYFAHNANNLEEGWDAVSEYAKNALLACWDGCHKIYLAMDEEEASWFRENYSEYLVEAPNNLVDAITDWWEESCSLKFVSAVWHNEEDPNDGFVSLISQSARW